MKASLKSLFLLLAGIILLGVGLVDAIMPVDDDAINLGATDNSTLFYILIGLLLSFAGVMGFIREAQKQGRRDKR